MPSARSEIVAPTIVFVLGLCTILGAWAFELIGGYAPCKLCLEQRVPYYVGLPVVLAALLAGLAGAKHTVVRTLLIVAALVFAFNIYLAVYQAGAEWAWWTGPTDCVGGAAPPTSAGDLLKELETARVVSCTEPSFRFLGLSFAGWNAVVSFILTAVALWGAFRPVDEPKAAPSTR